MSLRHFLLPACALALTFAAAAPAQVVINSVPYVINSSGKYLLGTNLSTGSASQYPIFINAPNVILDLNGFYVSGPGNTPTSNYAAIYVANVGNVTIRNGTVANQGYGIYFVGGANAINYLLENLNVTHCYIAGVNFNGVTVGSIVRSCSVSQIGDANSSSPSGNTFGLRDVGGVRIQGNTIGNVNGRGNNYGIYSFSFTTVTIDNVITNCATGIGGTTYKNNVTSGCTAPFSGGLDAGGNY